MSGQLVTHSVQLYNNQPSDADGERQVNIVLRGRTADTQQVTDMAHITASHATNEPDQHAQLRIRVHGGGEDGQMVDVATFQSDRVLLHHMANVPSLSVQGLRVGRDAQDGALVLAGPDAAEAAALAAQPLGAHVGDPLPLLPYRQLQWGTAPYTVSTWGTPATVTVVWPEPFAAADGTAASEPSAVEPFVFLTPQPSPGGVLSPWPYSWVVARSATTGTLAVGLQPPPGYPTVPTATEAVPPALASGIVHWMALV